MTIPPVLHIVRRYGYVGGMEGYVWELTHKLIALGVDVEVVCEEVIGIHDPKIIIHKLGHTYPLRPRWKSMLEFRSQSDKFVNAEISKRSVIVHSHERSLSHHVTTFHGPPMKRKKFWQGFKFLNQRINAWEAMERDELFGSNVRVVLPVSTMILDELSSLHPNLRNYQIYVAWPGVHPVGSTYESPLPSFNSEMRFLFVGKEWKRKGLDIAVKVVENIAKTCNATLDVYGPSQSELPLRIRNSPTVRVKGWVDLVPWSEYSALIHPARNEPFGMVVAEARQHGIPALISTNTGSKGLNFLGVTLCSIDASIEDWSDALLALTKTSDLYKSEVAWSWEQLAKLHLNQVYPQVLVLNKTSGF